MLARSVSWIVGGLIVGLNFALLPAQPALAQDTFIGRPIYSEPGTGMQMPPGCAIEPTSRARLAGSDLELWIVTCNATPRAWLVRRSVIEVLGANQARLRFQVLDDRAFNGEIAGDTLSLQCVARGTSDNGYVVSGAKWRAAGNELRLVSAQSVLRAEIATQKFSPVALALVECTRFPEREASLRRLQQNSSK